MIAPKVEGFAGQYTNATFIKVDVDEVGVRTAIPY